MDGIKEFNYIYNYIKYVYYTVEELSSEKYIIDICKRIIDNMRNNRFSDGKLDFYINNFVSQELRSKNSESFKSFETVKNYVYLLMNYYKIHNNVNIKDYNAVLYAITRVMCNKYSCDDVVSGEYDSEIEYMIQSEIE